MSHKYNIDLQTWKRREHFAWFNRFEEPFGGLCVQVDCTTAYEVARHCHYKFSLYYLYCSLQAANSVEPFRYRIEQEQVVCYDRVGADTTILRVDETYGCAHFDYDPDRDRFMTAALSEMERVQQTQGLCMNFVGEDTIYYSTLPWVPFTSVDHPRRFSQPTSVPRITFGQITSQGKHRLLPVDIHFHHALMDGFHVGQFIQCFQRLLNERMG